MRAPMLLRASGSKAGTQSKAQAQIKIWRPMKQQRSVDQWVGGWCHGLPTLAPPCTQPHVRACVLIQHMSLFSSCGGRGGGAACRWCCACCVSGCPPPTPRLPCCTWPRPCARRLRSQGPACACCTTPPPSARCCCRCRRLPRLPWGREGADGAARGGGRRRPKQKGAGARRRRRMRCVGARCCSRPRRHQQQRVVRRAAAGARAGAHH